MPVYISRKEGKHGCRIKVQKIYGNKIIGNEWYTVTVGDNPTPIGDTMPTKDFILIKKFIRINKKVIFDFWNGKINKETMETSIKSI